MSTRVGADIGALCRKCGDVWHVVIALDEGRIAKVECKQCGARHRYLAPHGERAKAKRKTATRARNAAKKSPVEADLSRPSRDFQMSDTYQVGDRILHPRFGEGVVQAVVGTRKVEVLFEGVAKTLVQGRPPTSSHD